MEIIVNKYLEKWDRNKYLEKWNKYPEFEVKYMRSRSRARRRPSGKAPLGIATTFYLKTLISCLEPDL